MMRESLRWLDCRDGLRRRARTDWVREKNTVDDVGIDNVRNSVITMNVAERLASKRQNMKKSSASITERGVGTKLWNCFSGSVFP